MGDTKPAHGQGGGGTPLDPSLRLSQYVHENWQTAQGLPQNSVYAVVQTRDGYLWLGTQEGLVRFDGRQFTILDRAHTEGLRSNEIRALLEDRHGALWVGTNGGGVSRFYQGEVTAYTQDHGLTSNLVRTLYEDRRGNLWVGTVEGGLNRFDGTTFRPYGEADGLGGHVALAVAEDVAGDLWVGTEVGLFRRHGDRFQAESGRHPLAAGVVWSLYRDSAGTLWVGTAGGLLRIRGQVTEALTAADGLCGTTVGSIYEDHSGTLWIGTLEGGLCRYRDGRFDAYTQRDGLTHDRVRAVYQDREGSLWVGTEGGGLNRFRTGKFTPLTTAEGLSSDAVFTVLEDRAGTLWVGTEGGGLNRMAGGRATHLSRASGLPSDDIYALHEDPAGRLWAGFYGGGFCRIDGGRQTCYGTADGLSSENVYALLGDRRGALWVGTEAGLDVLRDGRITPFHGDEAFRQPITTLLEDRAGALWVGTYGDGLRRVQGGKVTSYTTAEGLTSGIILVLHEDREGVLWAGTQGGGLCRITSTGLACATTREGLYNDNVLQILSDDDGNLWLGSNRGIFRLRKADFAALADGARKTLPTVVYSTADGLRSSEASGGTQPAAWRSRDGRLLFATTQGVASIDPARIQRNLLPPPVVIEQVFAGARLLAGAAPYVLEAGSREVTFQYTALSLTAPGQVRFQYRLEGYDTDWVDAGTRREAFYTGLTPGTYTFRVRAANNDGVWNEEGASASFKVEPFFYQTTWFAVLCALLLFGLVLAVHRIRVGQLKARERALERVVEERTHDLRLEKERTEEAKQVIEAQAEKLRELDRFKTRFFANISHEFRTPLTMIVGPLENALAGGYGILPDRMQQQVDIMLRNAMRLLRLINQLLDLSKLEAGKMSLQARPRNVVPFLEGIVLSCTAFAEKKGVTLTFEPERTDVELYYEPDKLEKVFFNLLSNAAKFTPSGGSIRVTATMLPPAAETAFPEGAIEVRVADTGRGIPASSLPHIFDRFHQVDGSNTREHEGTGIGLSLVKELVLLHRGTVAVESAVGVGTTFVIQLPLGRAHLSPEEVAADGEGTDDDMSAVFTELASSAFNYMHEDERPLPAVSGDGVPIEPALPDGTPLIVVADDNKDVREYVAGILGGTYRVVTAFDGQDALEKVLELMPSVVVSDVMMPRMDGNELCQHIKTNPTLNHIPVILLTARATHESRIEGLDVGADDHLAKPFNAKELLLRVRNLLNLRHQERALKEMNDVLADMVQEQVDAILEQRDQYESELIAERDRAEASERLKSAILDNMNHELRTPLTAILGYSEILTMEAPEPLQEFAAEIGQNSQRLMKTLDALLELSRLEAAAAHPMSDPARVLHAASSVIEEYEQFADRRALSLRLDGHPSEDLRAPIDQSALQQILRQLVDNAIKFTPAGEVWLEAGTRDGLVFISVGDTGPGIPDDFMPHLFEAFRQGSNGLTRTHEGVGLGLTVARRLAELYGGEILVSTSVGEGSLFTVQFPVRAVAEVG